MARRDPRRFFDDLAANVVWAAIVTLDEASQHEVLAELRLRLAVPESRDTPQEVREARAIAALREVAAMLGQSPSVLEFRRLRDENPAAGWPDDGSIRRWLGGRWNEALSRAHLETVPEPLAAVKPQGARLSQEEILIALREFAAEAEGPVNFHRYMCWARRPDVQSRPGRRPRSQNVFDRAFGGWRQAMAAAGLVRDDGTGAPMLYEDGRRAAGYRYRDQHFEAALLEVIDRRGAETLPSPGAYDRTRREILDGEADAGLPPRAFPGASTVTRRYGSWRAARERALKLLRKREEGDDG